MSGDGELQEGPIWEAVMFAGSKKLDNLCLLVNRNNGQLNIYSKTVSPMLGLASVFRSFGWQAFDVDVTQYDGVYAALDEFDTGRGMASRRPSLAVPPKAIAASPISLIGKSRRRGPAARPEVMLQREQSRKHDAEFGRFYALGRSTPPRGQGGRLEHARHGRRHRHGLDESPRPPLRRLVNSLFRVRKDS